MGLGGIPTTPLSLLYLYISINNKLYLSIHSNISTSLFLIINHNIIRIIEKLIISPVAISPPPPPLTLNRVADGSLEVNRRIKII